MFLGIDGGLSKELRGNRKIFCKKLSRGRSLPDAGALITRNLCFFVERFLKIKFTWRSMGAVLSDSTLVPKTVHRETAQLQIFCAMHTCAFTNDSQKAVA
jgi:hypothetical protein